MDITQVAKEIRSILKVNFPGTKFSVKSSRFSMGESVAISWVDGPAKNQVEPLVKMYGDGWSRFIKTSRKNSAVSVPEPEVAEVVAEAAPKPQESTTVADEQFTELIKLQELLISKVEEVNQLKLKIAELQVSADAVKYSQRQPKKADIAQITLSCDEVIITESGTSVITTTSVVATGWLEAEQILKQWAGTVNSPTLADKCRIVFEFSDGESFKLNSFGLMQQHRFNINLAQELLSKLIYCKYCKSESANYEQLLNNWEIPA